MLSTLALRSMTIPNGFRLPVSFYRGGTSKGLIRSTTVLAPYTRHVRDRLICRAMGSPDPDKRQIDGLGGGISSLSKTAIVGPPNTALSAQLKNLGTSFEDGVDYADVEELARDSETGWDLVYRFGQVPVENGFQVDWTSTCGNLISAVALFGLHQGYVDQSRISQVFENMQGRQPLVGDSFSFPARLLVTCSGQIVRANVPVTLYRNPESASTQATWYPDIEGHTSISGVPGIAPGILIEAPLNSTDLLPTGNQIDTVTLDASTSYPVTIINAGLPTIFIASCSLSSVLDPAEFSSLSPNELDKNTSLMGLLDQVRNASANLTPWLQKTISPSAPKICIVHPTPKGGYQTTGGERVKAKDMDVLIRAISVGNLHRTVPATCLSALAAGRAFPNSTIERAVQEGRMDAKREMRAEVAEAKEIVSIRVGQPAGVSEASVKVRPANHQEKRLGLESVPESIVYYRTARRIMQGFVDVPHSFISL